MRFDNIINMNNHSCILTMDEKFSRGESILDMSDMSSVCGLLKSGRAHITGTDSEGNEVSTFMLDVGDCFGQMISHELPGIEYYVIADSECIVTFINLDQAMRGCGRNCTYHGKLMQTLLLLLSKHSRTQSAYIDFLSRRSIREKLLACFNYYRDNTAVSDTFVLPMTYTDLAGYLCVDRAAMMRELKKMNDEGLISTKGKTITIRDREEK